MSRKIVFICVILALTSLVSLSADTISRPAATVNLIRNTIITVERLNNQVELYRQEMSSTTGAPAQINPIEVLQIMINDELVLQGAERDGFMVTEAQVDSLVRQQRQGIEQQIGRTITDAQFEQVVRNSFGMDLATYRRSLRETAIVDMYVRGTMSAVLQSYEKPTASQVQEFYRANRSAFMNPELVRLSHIFIPFTEENKAQVKREMDQLARWLRYNTFTFEELVPRYSQDASSVNRGGDIGWLAYDDEDMRAYLGPTFFDAVFALTPGRPSGVLESTGGYHIVKVTTQLDPKLLSIDDPINPESAVTVREYIEQTLTNRNMQIAYLQAIDELVQTLRTQAVIQVLYDGEMK